MFLGNGSEGEPAFILNTVTPLVDVVFLIRVLPEKQTGLHVLEKFPAFCGTRRFIIAFTRARHLSLSGV
jgi:hypothetical protein